MVFEMKPIAAPSAEPASAPLGRLALIEQMRTNVLAAYGLDAYRELNLHSRFLDRRSLLTSDPEIIREVLVERRESFRRTAATMRILRPVLGDGLFLAEGQDWKFQRRVMAPAFAPRAMNIVARVSHAAAAQTLGVLGSERRDVDLLEMMQEIALEVAGQAMFSLSMRRRGQRVRSLFEDYGREVGRPFALDLFLPPGIPSPADWRRHRLGRRWLACIDGLLNERLLMPRAAGEPNDLVDLLAEARDPDTGKGFDRKQLRDQFATMIIAGHETTALALLWALIMLAQSPHLQDALAAEAQTLSGSSAEALESLVLHRAVLQETLRLFPPAFLIVREALRPLRLAGRVFFEGDVVSIPPWLLHRHEKHWQAPGMFDPNRFMPGAKPPDRYQYLPFGAGPRVCIGMPFALTEGVAVLASLTAQFRIELEPGPPISPVAVVTTYPDPIPQFRLSRRDTSRLAGCIAASGLVLEINRLTPSAANMAVV